MKWIFAAVSAAVVIAAPAHADGNQYLADLAAHGVPWSVKATPSINDHPSWPNRTQVAAPSGPAMNGVSSTVMV